MSASEPKIVWVVLSSRTKDRNDGAWVDAVFSSERLSRAYIAAQGKWASLFWFEKHHIDLDDAGPLAR